MQRFFALCVFGILTCTIAQEKQEEWGFVTVRPGAHMFWWLYRSPVDWESKPLVMWLQVRMRGVLSKTLYARVLCITFMALCVCVLL